MSTLLFRSMEEARKHLKNYSLSRALASATIRSRPSERGLETEISDTLRAMRGEAPTDAILVPVEALAMRATSQISTGTGVHLAPDSYSWQAYLEPVSACIASGARVLEGLRGAVKIGALEKVTDALPASQLAETASQGDVSSPTFASKRLEPLGVIRTEHRLSQTLLNIQDPSAERQVALAIQASAGAALERRCLYGNSLGFTGLLSGDLDVDEDATAPSWANLRKMQRTLQDRGATTDRAASIITTQQAIDDMQARAISADVTEPVARAFDGSLNLYRSGSQLIRPSAQLDLVPNNESPSELTGHPLIFGEFRKLMTIGFFGPSAIEIVVDPFRLFESQIVVVHGFMMAANAVFPEAGVTATVELA